MMDGVELLEPRWLLVVAVVPLIFVLRRATLTDLSRAQLVIQSMLRSLVVVGLALALARPARLTESTRVATVVLVDVSDSVSDAQLAEARRFVDTAAAITGDGSLQIVTFAEQPRVVTTIARHTGRGAGSDIEAAMQLAFGIYPTGFVPRLVIVSDGNQTTGDAAVTAYRAHELGIAVSWRTFAAGATREVRVVGLTAPDDVKVGQPFELTAEVWTTEPQTVTLALTQDGFANPLEPTKRVALREGKNLVKLKSDAKRAGATSFRVALAHVEHDTEAANNAAVTTAPVTGRPSVLYVEGGREPGAARYLETALRHENIDVSVRGVAGLPSARRELERFDLVIVSDLPPHLVGSAQLAALDQYVKNGGGMIMAAGEEASGGYGGTRLEDMLPIKFDGRQDREQPDIALVLVIDRSSSMVGDKIEAAKESARLTAGALSRRDRLAVVAFDDAAKILVPLQPASNRMQIDSEIARLTAGGGTSIFAGLAMAFDVLKGVDAKVKHVILLSDGEAPPDGIVDLVRDMRGSRITVSAVGVRGADRRLLEQIIEAGDGRIEMIDDLEALPRFFLNETRIVQRSPLVEDSVSVRVAKQVEAIEGTDVAHAPPLHGYVITTAKPTAETILVSERAEPILARWRYGAGTAVAWTSDVKNRWSADWIRWRGYPKLWAQVVRSAMRRKVYDSYDLRATVVDGRARVVVDAVDSGDQFVSALDTKLVVIDPATDKPIRELAMAQTAPGRYTADVRLDRYGSFLLKAVHQRNGKTVAESLGSVALSYPLEYLRTTPNLEPLQHAARVSGGTDQIEPAKLFDPGSSSVTYTEDLWPWVLFGVVILLVLDLYAKRVRLFGLRVPQQ
ncbi:MAG: VWA domain-containing protein [Kofleriaceae bacterium]